MNQTGNGVYHGQVESKTKRILAIACLGKKFVFQSEISTYSLIIRLFYFQKYRNLVGSRSCSNRTKLGMEYRIFYLESNTKRIFYIAGLEKKFVFQSEISTYSLAIRLFYFQKYRNFIGSRSCSNQTKLGMEYPLCI